MKDRVGAACGSIGIWYNLIISTCLPACTVPDAPGERKCESASSVDTGLAGCGFGACVGVAHDRT